MSSRPLSPPLSGGLPVTLWALSTYAPLALTTPKVSVSVLLKNPLKCFWTQSKILALLPNWTICLRVWLENLRSDLEINADYSWSCGQTKRPKVFSLSTTVNSKWYFGQTKHFIMQCPELLDRYFSLGVYINTCYYHKVWRVHIFLNCMILQFRIQFCVHTILHW